MNSAVLRENADRRLSACIRLCNIVRSLELKLKVDFCTTAFRVVFRQPHIAEAAGCRPQAAMQNVREAMMQ